MLPKTKEKEEARNLRKQGKSLTEIVKILGVSSSSVSMWIRDIPVPERFTKEFKRKRKEERLKKLKEEREKNKRVRKERIISGDGRWMVPAPEGYKGKTYIKGLYIYEHRYIIENKIGRLLEYNDVVHHKDGDKLNNIPENLELKTRGSHTAHHTPKALMIELNCKWCGIKFEIPKRDWKSKIKKQENFFCCRSHQISYQQTQRWKK